MQTASPLQLIARATKNACYQHSCKNEKEDIFEQPDDQDYKEADRANAEGPIDSSETLENFFVQVPKSIKILQGNARSPRRFPATTE